MSKSLVAKYEQILEFDPASTAFVELARAYLEQGDNDKAAEVCARGCALHARSVVGRVLWGKALINVGRAAEAMKQFDAAVNIDKTNPYAYNLIAETLLKKGLYRSALPILKKAAVLQPNDARVTRWIEQAQLAIAGGAAPVVEDTLSTQQPLDERGRPIDPNKAPKPAVAKKVAAPAKKPSAQPAADPDVFAAFGTFDSDAPTMVGTLADLAPGTAHGKNGGASNNGSPFNDAQLQSTVQSLQKAAPQNQAPRRTSTAELNALPVIEGVLSTGTTGADLKAVSSDDPFDAFGPAPEPNGTVRGLTSTFDALFFPNDDEGAPEAPPVPALSPTSAAATTAPRDIHIPVLQPTPEPVQQPNLNQEQYDGMSDSGLEEIPTASFHAPLVGHGGLLDDLPPISTESQPGVRVPRVEFSAKATEAIALEYENELREKLEAKVAKKSFLSRHGLKLAGVFGLILVAAGFVASIRFTRASNQGESLQSALGKGLVAVNADTQAQYRAAIGFFETARRMDSSSTEAVANTAFARAVLYAEHGKSQADKDAALAALTPEVISAFPDYNVVVRALLDPATGRAALFETPNKTSKVLAQSAKFLLAEKKNDEALKLLSKAVELDPKNVRALVALGNYYVSYEDWSNAQNILSGPVASLSPQHPERVAGLAEARLALQVDTDAALSDFQAVVQQEKNLAALGPRFARAYGLTLSANRKFEQAFAVLREAKPTTPAEIADNQVALGQALREGGQMRESQEAFELALQKTPQNEAAKEGLARVLLARSREKELLEVIKPDGEARRLWLVRGIAWFRLGDYKKARAELARTEVKGKFPSETVAYLALIDAQEEKGEKPIEILQKLLTTTKRNRATVEVALARLYMQRGLLDKAKGLLENAAKDNADYEGNSLLGELLLQANVDTAVALEPLKTALEHNSSHAPARMLLVKELLRVGQIEEAYQHSKAWTLDNPKSEAGWKQVATSAWQSGRISEAVAALAPAGRGLDDVEGQRLRANVLFASGDAAGAMGALKRANSLNSKDADTFCEIGFAYLRQSTSDDAFEAFTAAKREDGKSYCADLGLALSRLQGRAKSQLTAMREKAPNGWLRGLTDAALARIALDERKPKEAKAMAEAVLKAVGGSAAAMLVLADAEHRLKEEAQSLEDARKAVSLDAAAAKARLFYAEALQRAGGDKLAQAIVQYEAAASLSKDAAEVTRAQKAAAALRKQAN
jgi:cellulose synthase operon protein C